MDRCHQNQHHCYYFGVRGEVLLQAFTYAQTRAPSSLLITIVGSLRWGYKWPGQRKAIRDALARGKKTGLLATVRWEDHWATPLSELRTMLSCPPPQALAS